MKVKDIIKQLQYCDPESEIRNSNGSEPEIRVDDQGVVIGGDRKYKTSKDEALEWVKKHGRKSVPIPSIKFPYTLFNLGKKNL